MEHLEPDLPPAPGDRREIPTRREADADAIARRVKLAASSAAREAGAHAARRTARRATGGYFALLFVLLVGATLYQATSDRRSCERVNTLRAEEANRTAQVMWAALMASRDRSQTLADATKGKERATHERAVREITKYAAAMRWAPRTDCARAHPLLGIPNGYRPPVPRPFTKRFRDLAILPE